MMTLPSNKGNSMTMWYLVMVSLLDFMGLGTVVAIFPHLLLGQGGVFPQTWTYESRLAALGIFLAIYPLGQFFGAAILGTLSDRYGRKNLLLITLLGTMLSFIFSGIAILVSSASLLFISRLCAGLFAGNIAIAQASMADLSDEQTKARNLGLLQIALGLAWVIGPPMGGWLSVVSVFGLNPFATSFWFMALLFGITLLYTLFAYHETLAERKQVSIHVFSGVMQVIHAYSHRRLRIAFLTWTVFVAGWWLFEAFLPAYLLEIFNFSSARIGTFLASMGATYALFQYIVVQRVSKYVKPESMVKNSLVISALSVLAIVFIHNVIILHVAITLFVTSMGFALPGLITSISNLASKDDQGQVMGTISSVQALATVLMMVAGGYLDHAGIDLSIMGGALLLLMGWIMFVVEFRKNSSSAATLLN